MVVSSLHHNMLWRAHKHFTLRVETERETSQKAYNQLQSTKQRSKHSNFEKPENLNRVNFVQQGLELFDTVPLTAHLPQTELHSPSYGSLKNRAQISSLERLKTC